MKAILRILRLVQVVVVLLLLTGGSFIWFSRIPATVTAQGEVRIERYQAVRPNVAGIVSNVLIRPGDLVRANQPLLQLEDYQRGLDVMSLKRDMEEKEAALQAVAQRRELLEQEIQRTELARQTTDVVRSELETERSGAKVTELQHLAEAMKDKYNRLLALAREGLVSQMEVEDARYALLRAEAQLLQGKLEEQESRVTRESSKDSLELLRKQHRQNIMGLESEEGTLRRQMSAINSRLASLQKLIAMQEVCAPADGVAVGLNTNELIGRRVEAGETIFTVADDKAIKFVAQVPEESIVKILPGQEVLVEINGLPKLQFEVFHGQIKSIDQQPVTGKGEGPTFYTVHIELQKPWLMSEGRPFFLQNGMGGKAKIIYRPETRLLRAITDALVGLSPY